MADTAAAASAAKRIAALPEARIPQLTVQRVEGRPLSPPAVPVKIGQAIDIEVAERLSNAFPQHPVERVKVMKARLGKRIVVFEIDVGDGK